MPSFFYVFALPLVACATGWALLFLPSKSTGEASRRLAHGAMLTHRHCPTGATPSHASPSSHAALPCCAGWLIRLDVGLAWFAALATLILVPADVASALAGEPPGGLAVWWRASYW